MEIDVPLASYPGRGVNVPISVSYSSKVWRMDFQEMYSRPFPSACGTSWDASFSDDSAAGWTSSMGTAYVEYTGKHQIYGQRGHPVDAVCISFDNPDGDPPGDTQNSYVKRVQIHLPSGESHELRASDSPIFYPKDSIPTPINMDGVYFSVDGSNLKYIEDAGTRRLYLPNGSYYDFGSNETYFNRVPIRKATLYSDINGNQLTFYEGNATYPNGYWVDTLQRVIPVPLPIKPPTDAGIVDYNIPGLAAAAMTYKFNWKKLKGATAADSALTDFGQSLKYVGDSRGYSGSPIRPASEVLFHSGFDSPTPNLVRDILPGDSSALVFNPVLLTAIELPNGQKYEFSYNIYGEIDHINYPTGGSESFQYDEVPIIGSAYRDENTPEKEAARGVKRRDVYESAAASPATWIYLTAPVRTVIAPDGTKTERYINSGVPPCFRCGLGSWGFSDVLAGRVTRELSYNSTGGLIAENKTTWEKTDFTPVSLPPSGVRRPVYPQWHPRVTKVESIIYDAGNSLSTTSTMNYAGDLNDITNHLDVNLTKQYGYTTAVGGLGQLEKQVDTTVMQYDPSFDWTEYKNRHIIGLPTRTAIKNGAGTTVAQTEIRYDEAGYGNGYRGQPTTSRSWTDVAANQYVETHAQYDNFGNVRKSWDARGKVSEIEYSPVYQYAYPTKTISAVPGGNGANTAFETSVEYDYTTGLAMRTIDANGQISTIEYNDPLLRPTRVVAPNGRQTITEYGAGTSSATRYVKVSEQIDANSWKEGYSWYDGLGRTVRTQSVDAQAGDVFVDTEYDQMGRVKRATNPYRAGEAVYWTQSFYDDLSRVVKIRAQDNSEVNTNYDLAVSGAQIGTSVTVTDQAGKPRRSITNSLGQLTRVDEPNAGYQLGTISAPAQPTFYEYDTLGNLTRVNQGVQARTFAYDALSRLKSAYNPESGTINYAYDANGNLTAKTDARNITTAYAYDALNRVQTRSYSDGITPPVSYFYDNLPNAKGQMIKVSNGFSTTEYTQFDQMSRVAQSKQTTDGAAYNSSYSYNLAGALIEQMYPSGRVVKNVLDADGDLSLVQSKRSGAANFSTYATNFSYTSAGAVSSMQLGNGRWESTAFNERLQPTQIALGTTPNATNLLKLNFEYGKLNWDGSTLAGTNNGNVSKQTINTPNTGNTYGFVATQYYTYDALNRSEIASENLQPNDGSLMINGWRQNYSYDRYGNRRFIITGDSSTTTIPQGCADVVCNPTANPTNNRLDGYTYDGAGNTIVDASGRGFSYDAENKQTEVKDGNNIVVGRYYYDGDGKRVKKVSATETTIFVYDAAGKLIAEYSNQTNQTPQISYLTNDHLGSPRIITDGNGNVTSRRDFQPFGEEVRTWYRVPNLGYAVDDDVRQKFTGYERDDESGLDFAQARYFNSGFGRFSSPDPYVIFFEIKKGKNAQERAEILYSYISQVQNWNKYVYGLNNPLIHTDPLGMRPLNKWEKQAIAKLNELIEAETGFFFNGELKNALENAKAEIEQVIGNLKDDQNDRGVQIAVYAILNIGNKDFSTSGVFNVSVGNTNFSIGVGTKCNVFVAAAHVGGAGLNFMKNGAKGSGFPLTNGVPPVANYLGDSRDTQKLSNLSIINEVGSMRPGDIAAWRSNDGNSSGHSSIYIGGGLVVYAGSSSNDGVPKVNSLQNLNNSMNSGHSFFVVRRYNGKP